MGQRPRHQSNRNKNRRPQSAPSTREALPVPERKVPVQYGKPFILLEDAEKKTFEYKGGQWVPHALSIAQCRESCEVKELPQKVNRMTRYEVALPLPSNA